MPSAAALRIEIERILEHRFPAALTPAPKTIREVAPTGIASVDAFLEGGLPVGAISEVTGPVSSVRTSLTLKFLAMRTEEGPSLRLGGCGRRVRSGGGGSERCEFETTAVGALPK